MNVQLCHLAKELAGERSKVQILEGRLTEIQNTLLAAKFDLNSIAEKDVQSVVGAGYADLSGRTIRRHVHDILAAVHLKAGGDRLKAAQLAEVVAHRAAGTPRQGVGAKEKALTEAKDLVFDSLVEYFRVLRETHDGRYPNAVRIAFQSVMSVLETRCLMDGPGEQW
jgi:hypothetical protein